MSGIVLTRQAANLQPLVHKCNDFRVVVAQPPVSASLKAGKSTPHSSQRQEVKSVEIKDGLWLEAEPARLRKALYDIPQASEARLHPAEQKGSYRPGFSLRSVECL